MIIVIHMLLSQVREDAEGVYVCVYVCMHACIVVVVVWVEMGRDG